MLLTKTKMACSGLTLIRLRMTYMNWPTLRSAGTRYFFLSMSGISERGARSTITWQVKGGGGERKCRVVVVLVLERQGKCDRELRTGTLSGYFSRILAASAWRFSARVQVFGIV
jgi:hypothetical protein